MKFACFILFGLLAFSCQDQNAPKKQSPADPQSIAQEILSSPIYREYTEVAKKIQFVMQKDRRVGAAIPEGNDLAGLSTASDKVAYLKENGYPSAAELHQLIEKSASLSESLLALFNDIETRVGTTKLQDALAYIDKYAAESYRLTAEEALAFSE